MSKLKALIKRDTKLFFKDKGIVFYFPYNAADTSVSLFYIFK